MEVLHTAVFETPVGHMRVASTAVGLAFVELTHTSGRGLEGWARIHAASAKIIEGFAPNRAAIGQLVEFLEGKRRDFDLSLDLRGTDFQRAVYEQVSAVGYGETVSYARVAERLGKPKAVRAVGAASGANPIPLIVPCHRIVASDGRLQGYAGGLDLKARLLAMESGSPRDGWLL